MKKINNKGFMLVETLVATVIVIGVLIGLYTQFSSVLRTYNDSFKYNTVENLYSLDNISTFVVSDYSAILQFDDELKDKEFIDITNCSYFAETEYCTDLLKFENIRSLYVSHNSFDKTKFKLDDEEFAKFIKKINPQEGGTYRLIAAFNDGSFATIRFGD